MSILTPEEAQKRRERTPRKPREQQVIQRQPEEEFFQDEPVIEAKNRSRKAKIRFETMGRFSIPTVAYFQDWSGEHITDLSLSNEEDILETVVSILNDIKDADEEFKIEDMLLQEFLEVMITIKANYDTPIHNHIWICDCQKGKNEKEVQTCETPIDLRNLEYKTIEEADNELKEYYRQGFNEWTDDEFREWVFEKYRNNPIDDMEDRTREKECENIKIKEPYHQIVECEDMEEQDVFFRFKRIKDFIQAQRLAEEDNASLIKSIQNRRYKQQMGDRVKFEEKKQHDLNEAKRKKLKDIANYVQALCIVEYNGKEITDPREKLSIFKTFRRASILEHINFLELINFGIINEQKFVCHHCGETNGRLLRKELHPLEFLPLADDTKDKLRPVKRGKIFM